MALTAQPAPPASWARWPQHHPNPDYVVMEPGMMPFDMRSMTSLSSLRPGSQYYSGAPLPPAPLPNMVAPAYQQQAPVHYDYPPFTPAPALDTQFKQEPQQYHHHAERTDLRFVSAEPEDEHARSLQGSRETHPSLSGSRSPSVKSEAQGSSTSSVSRRGSRSITSNFSTTCAIDFNTSVDALMKAIQAKPESNSMLRNGSTKSVSPETDVKLENTCSPTEQKADGFQNKDRKVFYCDIPGCPKTFNQKTHLSIHRRAHTGDKPYMCKLPGCGHRFSQLGNLKTHERRHTGEKPYNCPQCGKLFAQKGNVRAHLKTHNPTRPFECKLDNCHKSFTQLGNLKSHQNKFHIDTLKSLTSKFASIADLNSVSKADKELWEYFATLYKNSNKGIKGRGKHRKVGPITAHSSPQTSPVTPTNTMVHQFPVTLAHGLPQLQTPHPTHHPLPYHGVSHPAAYSMSRPNMLVNLNRESHHAYDLFDAEEVSNVAPSSTTGPLYEDDHGRELAFGDRMY